MKVVTSYNLRPYNYCSAGLKNYQPKYWMMYEFDAKLNNSSEINNANGIFAQWHGRPDRQSYKAKNGDIKSLPVDLGTIKNKNDYEEAVATYDKVINEGGIFEQGCYPPIAMGIKNGYVYITTRADPRKFTDKSLRCSIDNINTFPINHTKHCGPLSESLIYKSKLGNWVNQWKNIKFFVKWDVNNNDGFVIVFVNNELVAAWKGKVGRNDEHGPYMKFGIYSPRGSAASFSVNIKDPKILKF